MSFPNNKSENKLTNSIRAKYLFSKQNKNNGLFINGTLQWVLLYLNNLSNYNFFNTGKSSEKLKKMNTSEKIENNNNEDDNINKNNINKK